MQRISQDQFTQLLRAQRIKPRIAKELRFAPDNIEHWEDIELLAIPTRSGREGVLLIQIDNFYAVTYELLTGLTDKRTGRAKPITCDLCLTWQQGGKAGRITFERQADKHKFTYLCCGDLLCSLHVRNLTPESVLSRTQLPEDIETEQRITRLEQRVIRIVQTLDVQPQILWF